MKWRNLMFQMARVLVIILSFTLDIKVRADLKKPCADTIHEQSGDMEMDEVALGSCDIESFKGAKLRFTSAGTYFGFKDKTFITVNKNQVELHNGTVFVRTKSKDSFSLHSKEALVKSDQPSEFFVTSQDEETTVAVVSGQVQLLTRVKNKPQILTAGYSSWVGGLQANGLRSQGKIEALDLNRYQDDFEVLGGISLKDKNIALDHLRIAWQAAVDKISQEEQQDVSKNMATLEKWLKDKQREHIKNEKYRLQVKEFFKAHALDLPYQNKEFPSELPRSPASEH